MTPTPDTRPWLPDDWQHPTHVPVGDSGHHLRLLRTTDLDLELAALTRCRDRLWTIYGEAWGWPPAELTREFCLADLERHRAESEAHESFDYALFDTAETALLGSVYLDPPEKPGADAEVSWWVVDELVGSDLERALDAFVPAWIAECWPLRQPRYVGHDLTWAEWLALPPLARP
jgi:hypothetical protein